MNKKLLTLIASVTALSAQAQTVSYTMGDFDGDGQITVADLTRLTSIIVKLNPAQRISNAPGKLTVGNKEMNSVLLGDMDLDNDIDKDDLLKLLNVTLGIEEAPTLSFTIAEKDYNNRDSYAPMKEYVNRIEYPNFKVAAAVNANQFNQKGDLYNYAVANLDEVVADNAMKMSSVVNASGGMNFNTVTAFVDNATAAGLNVYGHTLAWHSQQPVAWLKSVVDNAGGFPYMINRDFSDGKPLGGWGGATYSIVDGATKISNTIEDKQDWEIQTAIDMADIPVMGNTYTLTMRIKSNVEGTITAGFQNPDGYKGCGNFPAITLTSDWQTVKLECEATGKGATRFLLNHGHIVGDIYIDDLKVFEGHIGDDDAFNGNSADQIEEVFFLDFSTGEQGANSWGNESTRTVSDGVLIISNPSESANDWDVQAAVDGYTFTDGVTYTLSLKVKADSESANKTMSIGFQQKDGYAGRGNFQGVTLTSDWQEVTRTCTVNGTGADRLLFNLGKIKGDIYFDDIRLTTKKAAEPTLVTETFIDYDFADESQLINGWGNNSSRKVEDGVLIINNPEGANYWEAQAAVDFETPFEEDQTYTLSMKVKSDATGVLRAGFQKPDGYADRGSFNNVDLSSEWKSVKLTCKVTGDAATRFLFSFGDVAGNIYIDDLKLYREYDPNATADSKEKTALIGAMKKWINNMMQATKGKVKAWDMINEAISGGGNVNGYYDLQHADGGAAGAWDVGGDTFYWQDFFGSKEYGAIVEKLAREAYANVEGTNPDDLKLFINDYNLEGTWDNCKKLESLIYWIGVWEDRGAKIDGIGTQMHISYFLDANDQKKQEQAITRMFTLMTATGKLVRVSELDMGIAEKQFGTMISQPTKDQQIAMAEYYQWIIQEYFRIVPKEQQWGICQWCINDQGANSGWRDGEPVGILDLSGKRKDSYVGWAEGLKSTWK